MYIYEVSSSSYVKCSTGKGSYYRRVKLFCCGCNRNRIVSLACMYIYIYIYIYIYTSLQNLTCKICGILSEKLQKLAISI